MSAPLPPIASPKDKATGRLVQSRMDDAAQMHVVEIKAMDQDSIDHGGVAQFEALRSPQHRTATTAPQRQTARHRAGGIVIGMGSKAEAERIQNMQFARVMTGSGTSGRCRSAAKQAIPLLAVPVGSSSLSMPVPQSCSALPSDSLPIIVNC
ncbi:hypothetical protein LWE61_03235 [Sphingobium sufflavum]|nr:hypothetical protein [Sphingobium sufflavum]MCE7795566.1 hypothetical protein [Sphingobium sufflavum]